MLGTLKLVTTVELAGVQVDIFSNLDTLRKRIRLFGKRGVERAHVRAINKSVMKTKTQARRALTDKFNLPNKLINQQLIPIKARTGKQAAGLQGRGAQIPLIDAKGGKTQTKVGVRMNTGGGSRVIRGAFIATMKSGHTGIFKRNVGGRNPRRVKYVTSAGQRQTKFLPIRELKFPSMAHMITNKKFARPLFRFFTIDYPIQLRRQLNVEHAKTLR